MRPRRLLFILLLMLTLPMAGTASNFSSGTNAAVKFGVHEIVLTGDGTVANPFDTIATVTFTPPSGRQNEKTVYAFHDGDNTWRARLYVSETGTWSWVSRSAHDSKLDAHRGNFSATNSPLRGRLLVHPQNPRQWITENGRWFLNLNDTAYFLLCTHDELNRPVTFADFTAYVRDVAALGVTSVRSWIVSGPNGMNHDDPKHVAGWSSIFADAEHNRFRTDYYQVADQRLTWMLENYPDIYIQLILFPRGSPWRMDSVFWTTLDAAQKARVLRYLLARYAAFPQVFWLSVNDAHFTPDRLDRKNLDQANAGGKTGFPNNVAFAREVGVYFHQHDPWQHPLSAGHARTVPWAFGTEEWATYIHLEALHDLNARGLTESARYGRPVFLGEDRYEQDRVGTAPEDMRYFQRRLFWAWLLAGGSANYGGYWWTLVPYSQAGHREVPSPHSGDTRIFRAPLNGLDSVRFIRDYFLDRRIELSNFEPDDQLVRDADGAATARAPRLMRRGFEEFLVYHPNAASDGREARPDSSKAAGLSIDLTGANGQFAVEWFRTFDGIAQASPAIAGGKPASLRAPWVGQDVVLRLRRIPNLKDTNP